MYVCDVWLNILSLVLNYELGNQNKELQNNEMHQIIQWPGVLETLKTNFPHTTKGQKGTLHMLILNNFI